MNRIIMHYDMDAFYASIELRENPKLKGKAMAVGQGVVTTASYEARAYGVRSAMPVAEAKKLCPHLITVPVRKTLYGEVASQIQELVRKLTHRIEFIAFDEGYIDITDIIKKYPSKEYFARRFQKGIEDNVRLTCSVGIGYNKLSAKIASDINKPGGIYMFNNREEFKEYISEQSVRVLPGVGKKMGEQLSKLGIEKGKDVYPFSLMQLIGKLGKSRGELIYQYSRGYDYREVDYKRKTHSIGNENTFRYLVETREEVMKEMEGLFDHTYKRLVKKDYLCKTITVKVRYQDRHTITRSKTFEIPHKHRFTLHEAMDEILDGIEVKDKIRLLGISFGNLSKKKSQQLTFGERGKLKKKVDIEILKEKINVIQKKG